MLDAERGLLRMGSYVFEEDNTGQSLDGSFLTFLDYHLKVDITAVEAVKGIYISIVANWKTISFLPGYSKERVMIFAIDN